METSLGLLKSHQQSSDIFGNFRKFLENVQEYSSGLRINFGKPLEIFGKWSEFLGRSSKTLSSVYIYYRKNITGQLQDMNFTFLWQAQ